MPSSFFPALLTSFLISPWLGASFKSIPPLVGLYSSKCREAAATTTRNTCSTTSRTCMPALRAPRSALLGRGNVHSGDSDVSLHQCQQQLRSRNERRRNNRNRGRFLMLAADDIPLCKLDELEAGVQKWCDRATSAFPLWVLGAALLGLTRPATMAWFRGDSITCALATTMVCMGITLSVDDFAAVARRPKPVIAGVVAQYTVMPLLGYLSGLLWKLPPGLAAGTTLVGCCPGGTASNLVTLIAKGDVALSVSMTTVSTLLAAAVTGPLAQLLVGSLVSISAATLMIATAQVVFLPVALGLVLNTYAQGFTRRILPYTPMLCVALVSMICGSVVAQNSVILVGSGARLVGAVLTLHAGGFGLGYGLMRFFRFSERQARTGSIEVGMQNSALAVVLAQRGLADPLSAVPGAVSATCHSLVGSALAAFWRATDRGGADNHLDEGSDGGEAAAGFAYEI